MVTRNLGAYSLRVTNITLNHGQSVACTAELLRRTEERSYLVVPFQ
jgi:hypothetical protein